MLSEPTGPFSPDQHQHTNGQPHPAPEPDDDVDARLPLIPIKVGNETRFITRREWEEMQGGEG